MWEALTDAARGLCVLMSFVILVLMQRQNHRQSHTWTSKQKRNHRFTTSLVILVFIGFIEKLLQDAQASIAPFVGVGVLCVGIWAITTRGPLDKTTAV